ncbi:1783_t:CDS:2 [Entrophospora sp. SA101]|nr:1783_t:CDS:2 [Entrophospora sp. SA101]CAJ0874047.1 22084_t:CDS:2 [Entrophospora sp. SA101]CAJ0874136.1 22207_t:CDS:2 [Entrophospora sp. SA101]CAJ0906778.1 16759_t:CDS:2 [Entrophospora sp. SA101]
MSDGFIKFKYEVTSFEVIDFGICGIMELYPQDEEGSLLLMPPSPVNLSSPETSNCTWE